MRLYTPALDVTIRTGLEQWLNCQSRCFGDKGDVEDITEGGCQECTSSYDVFPRSHG